MYLFHLVNRMVDGRPLVCWMDEFAKLLSDPAFAKFAKNGLETWRKKNANIATFTQSTSHVLDSGIARAIVEQTPTKILFPNPEADYDEYTQGFNLTDRSSRSSSRNSSLAPGSSSSSRTMSAWSRSSISTASMTRCTSFPGARAMSASCANASRTSDRIATNGSRPSARRWLTALPVRSHQENSHA